MAKKPVKQKKLLAHKNTIKFGSFERRRGLEGWAFSLPWIVGFLLLMVLPLFLSVRTSFYQTKLTDPFGFDGDSEFVGFDNYVEVVKDPAYGEVVFNSFLESLYKVPVVVAFALFVALLLKQNFPGRTIFRVIFFIPVILAGVIMTYLFSDDVGSISVFSTLTSSQTFSFVYKIFGKNIIGQIGTIMWASSVEILIFLAALQSVPAILYEVVELDGATAWESFWHVTLPYISPFVILNAVYALVDTFVDARNPVMSLLANLNSAGNKYGVAAALSWMYMLATLLVILIFILLTRRWLR